jgi:hypothetical protein
MNLREFKLQISPWIALFMGVTWVLSQLVPNPGDATWRDVYPGILLIVASLVLFGTIRWLDRGSPGREDNSENKSGSEAGR